LYPVSCKDVLVEGCIVSDASDAGIYVGQSTDVIVRNNKAFHNVAGIEIENCIRADVYENESYENTGGLFVFDLPELPQKNGHTIRLHHNKIWDNNLDNFAPPGNTVALVPAGTGVLIMSTRNVEIYENEIKNHRTTSTCLVSYLITQNPFEDTLYNPFSYGIYIHDNLFEQSPSLADTSKAMGKLVAGLFGTESPEIIYDGTMDPSMINLDGSVNENARICLQNNGSIRFANINAPSGFSKIDTAIEDYDCTLNID
jgi:parallel beta-helix repeat protein